MSFFAYTALYLTYSLDRIVLPDPLIFRTTLQNPLPAFDQTFTPAPLLFRTTLPDPVFLVTSPIVFTPAPLVLRVAAQDSTLVNVATVVFTPAPLLFRIPLQTSFLVAGDMIVTPEPLLFLAKLTNPAVVLGGIFPPVSVTVPFITRQIYEAVIISDAGTLRVPMQSANATLRPALAVPSIHQAPATTQPTLSRLFETIRSTHTETDQPTSTRWSNKGTWRYYDPRVPYTSVSETSYDWTTAGAVQSQVERHFHRTERGNAVAMDELVSIEGIDENGDAHSSYVHTITHQSSYRRTQTVGDLTIAYEVTAQEQSRTGSDATGAPINVTTSDRTYHNTWSEEIPLGGQVPSSPVDPPPDAEQDDALSQIPASNRNDCTVVIPAVSALLGDIVTQLNGGHPHITVSRVSVYSTGDALREVLFNMAIAGWQLSASEKRTMTLRGIGVSAPSIGNSHALAKVFNWQKDSTGTYQIRAPIDVTVKPGDLVTYAPDSLAVMVQSVAYAVSIGTVSMTIQGR
jgi:hypothetical protein